MWECGGGTMGISSERPKASWGLHAVLPFAKCALQSWSAAKQIIIKTNEMLRKTNKTNNHIFKYKDKRQIHSKTC